MIKVLVAQKKRLVSLLLVLAMTLSMLPSVAFATTSDINGHWAQKTLEKWSGMGWFNGNGNGTYRPNANITRAEFMTLINRMKGYTQESPDIAKYKDVSPDAWYYNALSVALAAGYSSGTGSDTMSPEKPITRQEAMTIISRISGVSSDNADLSVLGIALDGNKVADWAKSTVAACINEGLVAGSDGKINPTANITRAESVVLMDRVYTNVRTFAFKGTYGPANETRTASTIYITAPGVKLRNMNVSGDLNIDKSVGEGEVYLDNITVKGKLNAFGGGLNSIYLNNCNIKELIVEKDKVRVVLDNGSEISFMRLEGDEDIVELKGATKIETLTVTGANTTIKASADVAVGTLNTQADGIKIETQAGTKIETANLSGKTEITGQGSIGTANIKSDGCMIEKAPTSTNIDAGKKANVGGKEQSGTTPTTPGGGSGSGSGGGTSTTYQHHSAQNKTVAFGTQSGDLQLPASVTLTANTGVTGTANVAWNYGTYNSNVEGTYIITGTLSGSTVAWAPTFITITVTVQNPLTYTLPTIEIIVPFGTTEADAKVKLPSTVMATLSDASKIAVSISNWVCSVTYDGSPTNDTDYAFTGTVTGLPSNVLSTTPASATIKVLSSANSTPEAKTVELKANPVSVQRPTDATDKKVTLSATVKDQFGDIFNGSTLNYTLKESYTGVSYGLENFIPTVTITQTTTASALIATVAVDTTSIKDETTIYIMDEPIVATSIEMTNYVTEMLLPMTGNQSTYTFKGVVKDKNNSVMDGESITWSLKTPVTGVAIDANSGQVSVDSNAVADSSFIVVATSGTLTAEKTVSVKKAVSVATSISDIIGSDAIGIPSTGMVANTAIYTATLKDQYGVSVSGEIVWSLQVPVPGVTISNNTVSVSSSASDGSFVVVATSGTLTKTKTVTIAKSAPVVTSIEIVGESSIDKGGNATYTSIVKDQYGATMTGQTVIWSISPSANGVIVDANGKVNVASTSTATSLTLKAIVGSVSATMSVNITGGTLSVPAVKNIRFATGSNGLISLRWDTPKLSEHVNIEGYCVYISNNDGVTWEKATGNLNVNITSFYVSDLFDNKVETATYKFKVITVAKDGYTDAENISNISLDVTKNSNTVNITTSEYNKTTNELKVDGEFTIGHHYLMIANVNYSGGISTHNWNVNALDSTKIVYKYGSDFDMPMGSTVTVQEISNISVTENHAAFTISAKQQPHVNITIKSDSDLVAPTNVKFVDGLKITWDYTGTNHNGFEVSLYNEQHQQVNTYKITNAQQRSLNVDSILSFIKESGNYTFEIVATSSTNNSNPVILFVDATSKQPLDIIKIKKSTLSSGISHNIEGNFSSGIYGVTFYTNTTDSAPIYKRPIEITENKTVLSVMDAFNDELNYATVQHFYDSVINGNSDKLTISITKPQNPILEIVKTETEDGSEEHPFKVYNVDTLKKVGSGVDNWDLDKHYIMTADIDMSGVSDFTPIGSIYDFFTGSFNGNNYTISNLFMSNGVWLDDTGTGIFGGTSNATIKNIKLSNSKFYGRLKGYSKPIAAIIGVMEGGILENCSLSSTTIETNTRITGGVVGTAKNSIISKIHFEGDIISNNAFSVGGIVSTLDNSTISECSFLGNISAQDSHIGGIVYLLDNSTISDCDFSGEINTNGSTVGGIVYSSDNSKIENCFVKSTITSEDCGGVIYEGNDVIVLHVGFEGDIICNSTVGGSLGGVIRILNNSEISDARFLGILPEG